MKRIIVLLLVSLLIACVPTPDEEIVVNKTDNVLEETIAEQPQTEYALPDGGATPETAGGATLQKALDAPDTLNDSISGKVYGGTLTVKLNAAVHIPEVSAVPVYLVERYRPDASEKRRLAEWLSGETVFYDADPIGRDRYLNAANECREMLAALDESCRNHPDYEQNKAYWTEILENAMRDYNDGADGVRHLWEGSWSDSDLILYTGTGASVWLTTDDPDSAIIGYDAVHASIERAPSEMNEEQAMALARAFLDAIGAKNCRIKELRPSDPAPAQGAYTVVIEPCYAGIPVRRWSPYFGSDTAAQQAKVTYTHTAIREALHLEIRRGQVDLFDWTNPVRVVETANENVQLLPFAEILRIFRQQVFMNVYLDEGRNETLTVTDVYLSYRCIAKRDSDRFYLVPVWDFVGYREQDALHGKTVHELTFLTVNAIDGSIIACVS